MSLETAIERNTEALNTLIGILTKNVAPLEVQAQPALSAPQSEPAATPAVKTEKKEGVAPPDPTYQDAADVVNSVMKRKGTPAAKALLAQFEAQNLKQVDQSRYGDVIEAGWKLLLA